MTPGEQLAVKVGALHRQFVQHLLDEHCTAGNLADPMAVMIAAALTCRTFLNARQIMTDRGDVSDTQMMAERRLCVAILTEKNVDPEAMFHDGGDVRAGGMTHDD